MSRKLRVLAAVVLLFVLAGIGLFFSGPGKAFRDLWKIDVIQSLIAKPAERNYEPGRIANLKAIYVAMKLYHDSEGQFPDSSAWMDAIKNRLRINNMSETEALKKLIRPNLANPGPSEYGYAMNDVASKKYLGDIKDPATPLVFESSDLKWNAHGAPAGQQGFALTVAGNVVKLK